MATKKDTSKKTQTKRETNQKTQSNDLLKKGAPKLKLPPGSTKPKKGTSK